MLYHQNMINLRNERGIRIIIVIIIFVINFKQINNKFFKLKELILPFCCICIIFIINVIILKNIKFIIIIGICSKLNTSNLLIFGFFIITIPALFIFILKI